MTKQTVLETRKQLAKEKLQAMLPPGTTLYTVLRHCSSSGMLRVIDIVRINDSDVSGLPYLDDIGFTETYHRDTKRDGFRIGGAGMDMGFALINHLSYVVWGDGYPCIGPGDRAKGTPRCPSSYHQGEKYNDFATELTHKDGYALKQRWI